MLPLIVHSSSSATFPSEMHNLNVIMRNVKQIKTEGYSTKMTTKKLTYKLPNVKVIEVKDNLSLRETIEI